MSINMEIETFSVVFYSVELQGVHKLSQLTIDIESSVLEFGIDQKSLHGYC